MPRSSPVVRLLDGLLELGWLFIIIGVPVFFNVRDYRVFEPDKIVLLRNTVLLMAIVFLIKALYVAPLYLTRWFGGGGSPPTGNVLTDLRAALARRPVMIAALVFAVVYVLATLTSILPHISFWGSYDRMEGTYTYLTYILLFLLVSSHVRSWAQVERIVTAVILASVPAAAYSWLQHFKTDPLVWADPVQTALRTPSTMGNPIFMAAFLLMAVPFTLYRLVLRVEAILRAEPTAPAGMAEVWSALGTAGYGAALGLQLGAIGFSGSRGPALGLLAALIVFGLCIGLRRRVQWLLRGTLALAALLVIVFGATNTVFRSGDTPGAGISRFVHLLPSESGSSEVRSLLWKSSIGLVKEHPVLGCGPEVLIFCWYPHYPSELRKVELANAAPDRSHDEEIDVLLTTGVVGLVSYLALLAASIVVLMRLVQRAGDLRSITLAAALIAAFVGHIVEGLTGIAFSATLMLLWTIAAVATSLDAGERSGAAGSFAPALEPDLGVPVLEGTVPPTEPASMPPRSRGTGRATVPMDRKRQARGGRGPAGRSVSNRVTDRGNRYVFGTALSRLHGGALSILAIGIVGSILMLAGCAVLFNDNIQLVLADVDYRQGQNYETAAGQLVGNASTYQDGLRGYQLAIESYQNALSSQPTQDTYFLFLGKTLLEYAAALTGDRSGNTTHTYIESQVQQALGVFERAAKNNPLNPDHPRNIAKLYTFWGSSSFGKVDPAKLMLADLSYAKASSLAPHNPDILDEWATLDIQLGNADTAHVHRWFANARAHLERAQALFPEDANVYRDLGTVYGQYAAWAEQSHDTSQARSYTLLERDAWLKALGAPPVTQAATDYQKIYPRLAQLYLTELNDPCTAGIYANLGLKSITAGTLADPDKSIATALQGTLANATAHNCRVPAS